MYYVYILQSTKTGEFYKGQTDSIDRRLEEHFSGRSSTTKKMLPLQLIHVELCHTRDEARKIELFFKSGYGRETIREIVAKQADVAKW